MHGWNRLLVDPQSCSGGCPMGLGWGKASLLCGAAQSALDFSLLAMQLGVAMQRCRD